MKKAITRAAAGVAVAALLGGGALALTSPAQAKGSGTGISGGVGAVIHPEDPHASSVILGRAGAASGYSGLHATAGTPRRATARKSCLNSTDIDSGRGYSTKVDWYAGKVGAHFSLSLCAGTPLSVGGAQYAYDLGSVEMGTGRFPNRARWGQTYVAPKLGKGGRYPWQHPKVPARGGNITFTIPPVRNQCSQNDVTILSRGYSTWPRHLTAPRAEQQPRGVAFYNGNGKGCFNNPGVRLSGKCLADCTGQVLARVDVAATSPYATTTFRVLNAKTNNPVTDAKTGRALPPIVIHGAGKASRTWTTLDGYQVKVVYTISLGATSREKQLGTTVEYRCPPRPEIRVSYGLTCACVIQDAEVVDHNTSRYQHVVVIKHGNLTTRSTVQPRSDATISVPNLKLGETLTVSYQAYLQVDDGDQHTVIPVGTGKRLLRQTVTS